MASGPETGETNAEHYQRLAQECLDLLPQVLRPEARSVLIEMARAWQRLANEAKERHQWRGLIS